MANCFLMTFASVFSTREPDTPVQHQTGPDNAVLNSIDFSLEDVKGFLRALDPNSSVGPDGLHPQLLKSCSEALYMVFHRSLAEGSLPVEWKTSNVVPAFKKCSLCVPLNYRSVSLTSVSGKCMERLICGEVYLFLAENDILSEEQFGFRPGWSAEDQLLLTYDDIINNLDNGYITDLILFDFYKAFDRISHSVLEKLLCLEFRGDVIIGSETSLSVGQCKLW